jgi:hypothetical protein
MESWLVQAGRLGGRHRLSRSYSITWSARVSSDSRHGDAEHLCGLQVDYQLELDRLLHRQLGGALSLKDLTGIDAGLGPSGGDIGAVNKPSF